AYDRVIPLSQKPALMAVADQFERKAVCRDCSGFKQLACTAEHAFRRVDPCNFVARLGEGAQHDSTATAVVQNFAAAWKIAQPLQYYFQTSSEIRPRSILFCPSG